jgi:creatinine amidohydrolase
MRLEDLNWMDVERYLETDDRIILITGATEQHSYLSLLTDILIPSRMALAAAERERVLIAPPLNFGVSTEFMAFPGTISLSVQTFEIALGEIIDSLLQHGFTGFFVFNGHGGNRMPDRLQELHDEGYARIVWYDWWREAAVRGFEDQYQMRLEHANWGENFPFTRVTEVPAGEKPSVNTDLTAEGYSMRELLGDGSFGGPYQADDALMMELFNRVVGEVVEKLRTLRPM